MGDVLGRGIAMTYLSIVALIPLAAVVAKSLDSGIDSFWDAITTDQAIASLKLTLIASVIVVIVNALFGTLIAWVLVRDEFPGKGIVNSLIDLPFALPTIVAGLTLLLFYGPDSPVGIDLAFTRASVVVALLFVTLPFVVRAVQPVLLELDTEMEQAAESLGASKLDGLSPHRAAQPDAGDHRRGRPRVRARRGRVRLAGPHHGQHPVQDTGLLGADLLAGRERRTGVGGGRLDRAARDRPRGVALLRLAVQASAAP